MYLTHEEYLDYGGRLDVDGATFANLEADIRIELDAITFWRIDPESVTEKVKRCMAKLIDLSSAYDVTKKQVLSASNDGVTETYSPVSEAAMAGKRREIINVYLAGECTKEGIPLLYRGVS